MSHTIFIDGQEGTTGLMIRERLQDRSDLELLSIAAGERKQPQAKLACYRQAEVVVFCLPDQASRESFELARQAGVRIIDASTAFRTAPDWVYGLPELSSRQRQDIRNAEFVSNCGCHAAGFILALRPLITAGVVPANCPITCTSITGYSGGGKKLIQAVEGDPRGCLPPRPYALGLTHKHLPEMQHYTGLHHPPLFMPVLGDFYQGMIVTIPLVVETLARPVNPAQIRDLWLAYYADEPFIRIMTAEADQGLEDGFLSPLACNDTNRADLFVFGHQKQILLAVRLDNLGKGASGTAVQNLNLMLGLPESAGLVV